MKSLGFLLLAIMAMLLTDTKPTATQTNKEQITWTKDDSKAYARDMLGKWRDEQWTCLSNLWGKESAWNPRA